MLNHLVPGMTYLIEYRHDVEIVHQGTFVRYVDDHCAEFRDVACLYDSTGPCTHSDFMYFYSNVPRSYTPVTLIRYPVF